MGIIGALFIVCAIFMLLDSASIIYFINERDWNFVIFAGIIMFMIIFIVSMLDAISRGAI